MYIYIYNIKNKSHISKYILNFQGRNYDLLTCVYIYIYIHVIYMHVIYMQYIYTIYAIYKQYINIYEIYIHIYIYIYIYIYVYYICIYIYVYIYIYNIYIKRHCFTFQ